MPNTNGYTRTSSSAEEQLSKATGSASCNDADDAISLSTDNCDDCVDCGSSQWHPSGSWWKDLLYFAGPGWMVSIAYVDPGNYQADIQAGALSRYSLLCIIWWTSMLSIYVQILCVRLAFYSGLTLAEAQAKYLSPATSSKMRYINWFIAELSTMITDLPEVIGIGIACNIFFNWPYAVGVTMSLLTTMVFLMTLNYSTRLLEIIITVFIAIMAIALFMEMNFVGFNFKELLQGWIFGISDLTQDDIFSVTGVVGSVVMPHNLYLHTAACQSRASLIPKQHRHTAVFWSSIEPFLPIIISFFINLAVLTIAAERVNGTDNAANVGLTDFCTYFQTLTAGCILWGTALLSAGQSSVITTTYTGQYVMDGFLNLQLPIKLRAVITRLVVITPCIIISIVLPHRLNQMVNIVNALLSFLLPFAFTPLVMLNCNEVVMGGNASKRCEKYILYIFAFSVWFVNALGLSLNGGGFFGDWRHKKSDINSESNNNIGNVGIVTNIIMTICEISLQILYAAWNWHCINTNITSHEIISSSQDIEEEESELASDEGDQHLELI